MINSFVTLISLSFASKIRDLLRRSFTLLASHRSAIFSVIIVDNKLVNLPAVINLEVVVMNANLLQVFITVVEL